MAKKAKESATVTRISASDAKGVKSSKDESTTKTKIVAKTKATTKKKVARSENTKPSRRNPLAAFFGYFKGAWQELRQVHWPTRGATWSLTGAVLAFSAFFIIFILLLDAIFKFLFELLLK